MDPFTGTVGDFFSSRPKCPFAMRFVRNGYFRCLVAGMLFLHPTPSVWTCLWRSIIQIHGSIFYDSSKALAEFIFYEGGKSNRRFKLA